MPNTLVPTRIVSQVSEDIRDSEGAAHLTNMVNSGDVYERARQWLIGTTKRNPEALLVLAAGCALLMRGRAGSPQNAFTHSSGESRGL